MDTDMSLLSITLKDLWWNDAWFGKWTTEPACLDEPVL